MRVAAVCLLVAASSVLLSIEAVAQTQPRSLITKPIDESRLTVLQGDTHFLAQAGLDQGAAPADLPIQRMLMVLKRSDEQETALRTMIDDQQDKASPNYHKWTSPEVFGKQFGPSDQDIQQITSWLQSHGFQIAQVSKGRTVIEFSGTASQLQEALHTSIHQYSVNGTQRWANASDPQIPEALTPVVAGVESLNNFARTPMYHLGGVVTRTKATGEMKAQPSVTLPFGPCGVQSADCYGVGPYDFATIYNVASLWGQSPAVDGTGQTIAIVGETDINPQDVADFRNFFGLPALTSSQLNIIHNGPAPGILTGGEETESDLDVEWSSAVAKGATIDFVVSQSTETTAGIDLSAQYIIDNDVAPILSLSYGFCELGLGTAGNTFYNQLWQQAAAEGITVLISSGDTGSAGCSNQNSGPPAPSVYGLAVSGFASTPYNVAVGGTDFNDLTNASTYWSTANNSATQASALSYIPETTWNNSCTNSVFGTLLGFSADAESNCNNYQLVSAVVTVGGSGGRSNCTSSDGQNPSSCSAGYGKPSWQAGPGVPADSVRDIPDVSLFAAAGSPSGSFYIICEADLVGGGGNSCNPANSFTQFIGIGGTSASAPAFAGIMALINQQTNSRQGNANYVFYKLAANQPSVFHDVPAGGTIAMPCRSGSPNCTTASTGHVYGIQNGFTSGTGYDLATGLGSVNVANLVNKWNTVTFNASTTALTTLSPTTLVHGQTANVAIRVSGSAGTPIGPVALLSSSGNSLIDTHLLDSTGAATWTTKLLPGGTYTVKAHYAGDGNYGGSDSASTSVTVTKEGSSSQIQLETFSENGLLLNPNASSAVYGSPYLLRVNVLNSQSAGCSTQPGCASGTVALTDNGSPLDAGTYSLNNFGYFEDLTVQLSGGAHALRAAYSGDNSYIGNSSPTNQVTISPAATTLSAPSSYAPQVGYQFQSSATVQSAGSGAAPSGAITFFANGVPMVGTVTYTPTSGANFGTPSLFASFTSTSSPFLAPGSYNLTASYSGDPNYSSSTSPVTNVTVKFPPPTMGLQVSAYTVTPGTTITLTALVISSSPTVAPTGPVTISSDSYGPLPGAISYSTVRDQNGNLDLQASIPFTIAASDNFAVQYAGDSNYPTGFAGSGLVTVTGNDFSLTIPQNSLTITKGQIGTLNLVVGTQDSTAPVTFSAVCAGLPKESSCSFPLSTISYTTDAQVSISTTAPHSASQKLASRSGRWFGWLGASSTMLIGIFIVGLPLRRKDRKFVLALCLVCLLAVGIGCGGGGSTATAPPVVTPADPGTPSGTYTVTLTATSATITHTAQFTLIVQ